MFAAIDREERSILEARVRYEGYIASRMRRSSSACEENHAPSAKPRGSRE